MKTAAPGEERADSEESCRDKQEEQSCEEGHTNDQK